MRISNMSPATTLAMAAALSVALLCGCTGPVVEPPTLEERGAPEPGHYPTTPPITTPYPTFSGDAVWRSESANQFFNHRVDVEGPVSPALAWSVSNPGEYQDRGVVDEQGHFFVLAGQQVLAYSPQGAELWRSRLDAKGAGGTNPVVLRAAGGVHVCDSEGCIYAFTASGSRAWKFKPADTGSISGGLASGADGQLYAEIGKVLISISPEGSELWRWETQSGYSFRGLTVAEGGGALLIEDHNINTNNRVTLIREGSILWSQSFAGGVFGGMQQGDGQVFALTVDEGLAVINAEDGTVTLKSTPRDYVFGQRSLSRAPDGSLCSLTFTPTLVVFNADGTFRAEYPLPHEPRSQAEMRPDGTFAMLYEVYADFPNPPSEGLACISLNGSLVWKYPIFGYSHQPLSGADGSIYILGDSRLSRFIDPGIQTWEVQRNLDGTQKPIFDEAGNMYVNGAGELRSYTPEGSLRWHRPLGNVFGMIRLGSAGRIYFQEGNRLHSYDSASGSQQWTRELEVPLDDGQHSQVIVGADGSLVSLVSGFSIYGLSPDGTVRWLYVSDADLDSSPVIGEDGNIFTTLRRNGVSALLALDRNGIELWEKSVGGTAGRLMLDGAGRIYAAGSGNQLHAFTTDGTALWSINTGVASRTKYAVGRDGPIVFSDLAGVGSITAYDMDGTKLWEYPLELNISPEPAVDAEGRIYVGDKFATVWCISPEGSELWHYDLDDGESGRCELALSPQGRLTIARGQSMTVLEDLE